MINNMKITKSDCTGCYCCHDICPHKCIQMKEDIEGFLYPYTNIKNCVHCGLCIETCPVLNTPSKDFTYKVTGWRMYNKDEEVRFASSSGGIFTLLAEKIIADKGAVVCAIYDNDFNVIHVPICEIEGLDKARGSKYSQSSMKNIYSRIKALLKDGKQVLFIGTPCQTASVYSFFKGHTENLILVDFICHGVASPKVWSAYLNFLQKRYHFKIQRVNQRHKKYGWQWYSTQIKDQKNMKKTFMHKIDLFSRGYQSNLFLRPSCYNCNFKSLKKYSDITLGDLWGIKYLLNQDDDRGMSLVLINSTKGKKMLDAIESKVDKSTIPINQAIDYNQAIITSSERNDKRTDFFVEFNHCKFDQLINKYCPQSKGYKLSLRISMLKRNVRHLIK